MSKKINFSFYCKKMGKFKRDLARKYTAEINGKGEDMPIISAIAKYTARLVKLFTSPSQRRAIGEKFENRLYDEKRSHPSMLKKNTEGKNQSEKRQDWRNQQQNAIKNVLDLGEYFPNISKEFREEIHGFIKANGLKFQITPYMLSQFPSDLSLDELKNSTWFKQFFPPGEIYVSGGLDAYKMKENRDRPGEFATSMLHHKYTNRGLLRFRECLGYCNFCFEAERALEKHPAKHKIVKINQEERKASLKYIQEHSEIEEIVFSGGEPLLLSNEKLEAYLQDLRKETKIKFIRIHTRALTMNPFRIDKKLVEIFKEYRVSSIVFDVAHPDEITSEFIEATQKIKDGAGLLMASHTPLLKDINVFASLQESVDTLRELFSKLYENNIKPYYLLHTMPHIPFADKQRASVADGIKIIKQLKRHKSNISLPEYIIPHPTGKITIPPFIQSEGNFRHTEDEKGNPTIEFVNREDEWVTYLDAKDVITKD